MARVRRASARMRAETSYGTIGSVTWSSARLESGHDVVAVGANGDHDHRGVGAAADVAADLEAVAAGQHEVEQDDADGLLGEQPETLLAGLGLGHLQALAAQGHRQEAPDPIVVLDDQRGRPRPGHCPCPALPIAAHGHPRSSTTRRCRRDRVCWGGDPRRRRSRRTGDPQPNARDARPRPARPAGDRHGPVTPVTAPVANA